MTKASRAIGGFTLVEVLVALAIVALSIASALRASGLLVQGVARQSQTLLAQACAENELARMRARREYPGSGVQESACEQAGRMFRVQIEVAPTPNPSFVKLDVSVEEDGVSAYKMSALGSEF